MFRARLLVSASVCVVTAVSAGNASAAPFIERFETYSVGQTVYTEGGGSGATVYQEATVQSPFGIAGDTKGLKLGNSGSDVNPRIATSVSQDTPGDYRLQWDMAQIYNAGGAGSASDQALFVRWGTYTNIALYAVSQTGGTSTSYDLKYYDGSTLVDTGVDLADDVWYRFRLEWNTTNSSTQTLYVNDSVAVSGQLIYGTIAAPATLNFIQWTAVNYAFTVDNIAFDTGTGPIPIAIPEPASGAVLVMAAGAMTMRRRRDPVIV